MKRLLAALAVGGIVATAAIGAASTLSVDGGAVQVGVDELLQCDTDGVTVSYNINYNAVVTSVQVNGISDDCAGNRLVVVLEDASGNMIGTGGAIDTGTGAGPIAPQPTLLFTNLGNAACDSTSCKVQIAPVDSNGVNTGNNGGHGVDGELIEHVVLMVEGANGL